MALFLQESIKATPVAKTQSLQDCLFEMNDIAISGGLLTEALIKADFVIHESSKTLEESAVVLKEAEFIKKAYAKVKEWAVKAWEAIKRFAASVKAKAMEYYNRIKDRVKGDTVIVNAAAVKQVQIGEELVASFAKLVQQTADGKENVADAYQKKFADAAKTEGKGMTVSITFFEKIQQVAASLEKQVETAAAEIQKQIDAAEKEVEAAQKDEKASKERIAKQSERIAKLKSATSTAHIIISMAVRAIMEGFKSVKSVKADEKKEEAKA